jgi:hypothetical protein
VAEILVMHAEGDVFDVTVADGASKTEHEVRAGLADLDLDGCDPRLVVEESFRFLLEREPKEAILASFTLARIGDFFPEYPEEIRRRMRGELD